LIVEKIKVSVDFSRDYLSSFDKGKCLRVENFIYFFTICGFFIGLVFSIINFAEPEYILFYTAIITLFFYLLIHVVIANFLDIKVLSKKFFDKERYEEVSDYFIFELETRERRMESLVNYIENFKPQNDKKHRVKDENYNKIAA